MDAPPFFTLPESFAPMEFLPPRLMMHADYARYLVSLVLSKLAHGRVDERGFVRLQSKYLRAVMQRQCKPIVDALVNGGALRRAPYTVGKESFGYALGERFASDRHVRRPVTHPLLVEHLRKQREAVQAELDSREKPIHLHLRRRQRSLEIDTGRAREVLATLPPKSNRFDVQGILVSNIAGRDYRLSVSRWGRVSNNITNLKRELRRTLHVHGEQLAGVDVSCCQPALFALLMEWSKSPPGGVKGAQSFNGSLLLPSFPCLPSCLSSFPPDVAKFRGLSSSGCLYEFLIDRLRENGTVVSRDKLKRRFLTDVLAKAKANEKTGAEYPSRIEDVFRAEFPTVYRFIRSVNCDGWHHANLIRTLQRVESWLVIENVCQRFAERHPRTFLITLHDAIYCLPRHVDAVCSAFQDVFRDLNFEMRLKVGE